MKRRALLIATLVAAIALGAAQDRFTLELPPGMTRSQLRIQSQIIGPAGSYGSLGDSLSVPLETKEGQRATSIKAILYSPGCRLSTIQATPPTQGSMTAKFECRKLATIPLHGSVTGVARPAGMRMHLLYVAPWSHQFFGILDGIVYQAMVAETKVDQKGRFTFDVPDFTNDPVHNSFAVPSQLESHLVIVGTYEGRTVLLRPQELNANIPIQAEYKDATYLAH